MVRTFGHLAEILGAIDGLSRRLWPLALLGALIAGIALVQPWGRTGAAALLAGITLAFLASGLAILLGLNKHRDRVLRRQLTEILGHDVTPCFSTDMAGIVGFQNAAARKRFGTQRDESLINALHDYFANPSAVLFRLQSRADLMGSAREDVTSQKGQLRLSVHRFSPERFLWRLEEFSDRPSNGRGADVLSLPMLVVNRSGVILFSNEALRRLTGTRPRSLDQVFQGPLPQPGHEVSVKTNNGAIRAFFAQVDGPGERHEVYLMPLTEREFDQPSDDFESLPIALAKFSPDGHLRQANRLAREVMGLTGPGEPLVSDLFEGLGRSLSDWVADVATARRPSGAEVLRLRGAEEDRFFQLSLRRIVEDGRVRVLAIITDATDLKRLEAQFHQSQKMQAVGELAGGVAHDFNNLLTAISGHCDLLLLRHDQDDPEYADLQQIHQNANRAAALVRQLLGFSRKQTLRPERIDLADVLSEMTHLLNRLVGERMRLRVTHAPGLGPIRADKRQLEQVLMNLVVNARDAMPGGGTIGVETQALTLREPLERDRATVPPGHYAVIRVTDTGDGIAPENMSKIFEPFFTTKKIGEGTGLGLSMAYGIVKQSGGYIFCDSVPGQGTRFELVFPINDSPVEGTKALTRPSAQRLSRSGENVVMLVEDEAPVRAFAARALRLRGYGVLEAVDGEDALRQLADPQLTVDLFVSDVVMPGMDGPAWVRQARANRPQVPVIFMSGYAEEGLAEGQARIDNASFLPKPFSLNDLTAAVQACLSR
ncbi:hybrid sensor histidine kinase/response regulator [Neogemmobacter tilapiae]|nr:ATP-binding protein [Gemmobacter tilapiae]